MNLKNLHARPIPAQPWAEGENIPWDDPAFSQRILREHLSQKHDAASHRTRIIKKQVKWIHNLVLAKKASRILDLGCGPGLYCVELAALGHVCHGIDFSPASIAYAVKNAPENCTYALGDLRSATLPPGFDLVQLIFSEFNHFKPADARQILQKIRAALTPGGSLLLEMQSFDTVEQMGNQLPSWYSSLGGLFSANPHICLMESFWDEEQAAATERYLILEENAPIARYASTTLAYTEEEIAALLTESGFTGLEFHPSLTGQASESPEDFIVVTARR
ncbi:MAG: class I SAM-dependent methyltransferase [Anaerolineales bacterium]|jgi:SAM-dependent methyltransferase|nr:class I SAM-dependent methyltransferase [Anaerolineales bacterium]